jgi:hypothetical protein
MRQAREALRALPPEQREELRFNGIGPGDSYLDVWRMVNLYRRRLDQIVTRISHHERRGALDAGELAKMERDERYYSAQITSLCGKLLVHEKPKLASVELKGDPQSPLYHEVDLKNLSDEDLHALARILPKLGGASQSGELAAGAQGNAPARGGARAPAGRARRPS